MDKNNFIMAMEDKSNRRKIQDQLISACFNDDQIVNLCIKKMSTESEHAPFYARVLEFAVKLDPDVLLTQLGPFCDHLSMLTADGCCRSSAKICELLMIASVVKKDPEVKMALNNWCQQKIIESCFDWKINNRATAIQAHAMYALYLLGFSHSWIHSDLTLLIEKNLPMGSIGYKNRGRKIIKAVGTGNFYRL